MTGYEGYGTNAKPAFEPIILARAPIDGTVAANAVKHKTGGLNIDGCRIQVVGEVLRAPQSDPNARVQRTTGERDRFVSQTDTDKMHSAQRESVERTNRLGRWPANVLLDEAAARLLDEQAGERGGGFGVRGKGRSILGEGGSLDRETGQTVGFGDSGGPSRFFYTSKASGEDRGHRDLPALPLFGVEGEKQHNVHPTVKPLDLMEWLVRLVTQPGKGLILDPFCGSGSTLLACKRLGVPCLGIDLSEEYLEIARRRLEQAGQEVGL